MLCYSKRVGRETAYTFTQPPTLGEKEIDTTTQLLIRDSNLPLEAAFYEAERAIRGDAFASLYVDELALPGIRSEVVAYMAECLLAQRPVTPTYAIKYLGYWSEFKANVFKLVALEETVLQESEGEGVTLTETARRLLQGAPAA